MRTAGARRTRAALVVVAAVLVAAGCTESDEPTGVAVVLDSEGRPLDDRGPGFVELVPVVPADPPVAATPPVTATPPTAERPEVAEVAESATPEPAKSADSSPTPAATSAPSTEPAGPEPGTALAVLETLEVKGRAALTGYEREAYGQAWADVDRNGCDTRNDMLRRDLVELLVRPGTNGCLIESGALRPDPYTGVRIEFVRGGTSEVDIDHVVALADSWVTGAARWEERKRIAFGNDPLNLLAVDAGANRQKGAGDAATWLPQASYRCSYVARQIAVKAKYDLAVKPAERDAMTRVLSTCPDQQPPAYGAVVLPPPGLGSAPPRTAAPKPADPAPAPGPAGGTDPRFDFCYQAKDAGYGPYVRGEDAEYPWYRDADSDGVVCE